MTIHEKLTQLIKQLQNLDQNMLRGSLIKRYKKCGKTNCHCVKEQAHESYYLSVSIAGKKPVMVYIPNKDQDRVRKALANYQYARGILEDISTINREALTRKENL